MASKKAAALAQRLRNGEFITAPGVYDMISARVADGPCSVWSCH